VTGIRAQTKFIVDFTAQDALLCLLISFDHTQEKSETAASFENLFRLPHKYFNKQNRLRKAEEGVGAHLLLNH
jgi:hypothetical protein